jgi:PhnB protein
LNPIGSSVIPSVISSVEQGVRIQLQLAPYLFFNGNCEAAFHFYANCLGGKITAMQSNRDAPTAAEMTPEWRTKIRHACLLVGTREFMGADRRPEVYEAPKGFSVLLGCVNPTEAERVFRALAVGGTVTAPFGETFWAQRFGMLVDQFGIPWMINCYPLPPVNRAMSTT